jgi:hypothetical protein
MPQWLRPSSATSEGTPLTPAASASRRIAWRREPSPDGFLRVQPGALGRPRDLGVRCDVLTLAEERLVERVLEVPQPSLLLGPKAHGERQGRARLVAREVDLDPALERPAVHRLRPVGAKVVAANLEQRLRGRAELVREPVHVDVAAVLGRLDDVRLHVRVRADDVVVEGDARHGASLELLTE